MYSRLRSAVANARANSANSSISGSRSRGTDAITSDTKTASSLPNFTVDHDVGRKEFVIKIDNERAFIQYNKIGNVMYLEHTEVPEAFSGRGIGKILAKVCNARRIY